MSDCDWCSNPPQGEFRSCSDCFDKAEAYVLRLTGDTRGEEILREYFCLELRKA